MNVVLVLSILLRIGGAGYSLVLLKRCRDRRFGFLTLMLSLMATRQILTAQRSATAIEELPGLVVSVLAILTVYYLASYVEDEREIKERLHRTNDQLRSFRKAVEHAGHAIFLTETDGTIEYANPAVEKVSGYEPEAVVGENPRLWKSGEHDDEFYAEMWEQIASGDVWEGEIINRRESGELCWVDVTIAPIMDDRDRVERYVAVERDVTDRKERELQIREQNERLELLNNTNEVLRDVNRDLVAASTRDEVEASVCERFAGSDLFDLAWVGDRSLVDGGLRPRTEAGVEEGDLSDHAAAIHGGDPSPVESALEGETPVFVDDVTVPGTDRGTGTAVVVPLSYRGAEYGVLVVAAANGDAFDAIDRAVFADLGATIADAISGIESKQTLTSDNVTELEFQLGGVDEPIVRLSETLDCAVELERVALDGDDRVEYFTLRNCDADAVEEYVESEPGITDAQWLCTYEDRCLFRFAVDDRSVVNTLASYGAAVTRLDADGGQGRLVAEVSRTNDVRSVVEAVRSRFPELTLVAQREHERDAETESEFRANLESSLTDRQLEAAQTAYFAGFFEWPRTSSGEDVASAMDISQSTFTQHLRSAERKLFGALFDEPTNPERQRLEQPAS